LGDLPLARTGAPRAAAILEQVLGAASATFAVINPGASAAQAYKRPPAPLLGAAAQALARAGVPALVVWGPGEGGDARLVVEEAGGAAVLAPPTDLAVLAALIERARLFVGGDSGPMHLACLLGRPALVLYGATDPAVNGPWGGPTRALYPAGRGYTGIPSRDRRGAGFDGLSHEEVARAVAELLAETGPIERQAPS
jgi:ADP-heptose:LPS heptosyltransferase